MTTNTHAAPPVAVTGRLCGTTEFLDRLTVDQPAAEKVSGLSAKTLGRLADRGERVGRLKVGRRVLFHLPTLHAWLAARAADPADQPDAEGGAR